MWEERNKITSLVRQIIEPLENGADIVTAKESNQDFRFGLRVFRKVFAKHVRLLSPPNSVSDLAVDQKMEKNKTQSNSLLGEIFISLLMFFGGACVGLIVLFLVVLKLLSLKLLFITFLVFLTVILILQGLFTLFWMLYAWEDPEEAKNHKSPSVFKEPNYSFTALVPARNEEKVIKDTLVAINQIKYPKYLKEIIVLCRRDDMNTITRAQEIINEIGDENIYIHVFDGEQASKPHALNEGLRVAKNQIITIFDAEDEPHEDIYSVMNTIFIEEKVDVVQSGVQLMNYRSNWFSSLNCMEYFFWFKSGLHFFSKICKVAPLGGNTVFFKNDCLKEVKGWDEDCLTEDADIGLRLVEAGATIRVVYDEVHVTKEETPSSVRELIRQRTRWNQGFMQVFSKGDWKKLPTLKQKITALYILLTPELQAILLLYTPLAIILAFVVKVSVLLSLLSFIPLFLFVLQAVTLSVGLYEFTKAYNLKFRIWMPIRLILVFYPYQIILMISSIRAMYRQMSNVNIWEKTSHLNAHRKNVKPTYV